MLDRAEYGLIRVLVPNVHVQFRPHEVGISLLGQNLSGLLILGIHRVSSCSEGLWLVSVGILGEKLGLLVDISRRLSPLRLIYSKTSLECGCPCLIHDWYISWLYLWHLLRCGFCHCSEGIKGLIVKRA